MITTVLDKKTERKITEFVYQKPRSINEIALFLNKNWRTADRYITKIQEESGHLSTRTFREGSRGALKVVYYNNVDKIANTDFQQRLLNQIQAGRKKEDFTPFDIYQYIHNNKRKAFLEVQQKEFATIEQDIVQLLQSATKTVMFFSGNMSWANVKQKNTKVVDVLKKIAKKGVAIKVITRVDIASINNLKKVLRINEELGRQAIEIRHAYQPLRCVLVDHQIARFKETKNPNLYKSGELNEQTFIFYDIYDEEWIEWLQKVFWSLFSTAPTASHRMDALKSIEKIDLISTKS